MRKYKGATKRKIYGVFDLGRVPLTDETGNPIVGNAEPEPTTLQGFIEKQRRQDLKKQQTQEAQEAARQRASYDARVADYYRQPSETVAYSLTGMRDDYSGLNHGGENDIEAGKKFVEELIARSITLSDSGRQRLAAYLTHQAAHTHGGVAITVANIWRGLQRLKSLDVFAAGELTEPQPEPVEPQSQGPTMAELYARADDSPQADRELRSIIGGMFNAEVREVIEAWLHNIHVNYGVALVERQIREAWNYIQARNLAPLSRASWDIARRFLISRSLLSDSCQTCREFLERQFREGVLSHHDFLTRCRTLEIAGVLDKPRAYATQS